MKTFLISIGFKHEKSVISAEADAKLGVTADAHCSIEDMEGGTIHLAWANYRVETEDESDARLLAGIRALVASGLPPSAIESANVWARELDS